MTSYVLVRRAPAATDVTASEYIMQYLLLDKKQMQHFFAKCVNIVNDTVWSK